MLSFSLRIVLFASAAADQIRRWWGRRLAVVVRSSDRGQATAEYALVMLGAAAIALLLTAWAARSGAIGRLFDAVVDQLIGKVS